MGTVSYIFVPPLHSNIATYFIPLQHEKRKKVARFVGPAQIGRRKQGAFPKLT